MEYIKDASQSPEEFHFWSAASIIASTLKRSVWADRGLFKLYPNMYIMLIGNPATGKGASLGPAMDILTEANTANILSQRMTIEYALQAMAQGFPQTPITAGQVIIGTDHSATIYAPELSVFLRGKTDYLPDLTELWDSKDKFDDSTIMRGSKSIKNPCVNLLAGAPPAWLAKSIPTDAIGGGFTRRVNFVYTRSNPVLPSWDVPVVLTNTKLKDALIEDLRHMSAKLRGAFKRTDAFAKCFDAYTQGTIFSDYDDEATMGFKASKWANVAKLAMVLSASRDDKLTLNEDDCKMAIARVDQVEKDLQVVFRAVGESSDAAAAGKILNFLETKGSGSIKQIMAALWKHVSREDCIRIISTFEEAGLVKTKTVGITTVYQFAGPPTGKGKTP